MTMPLVSLTDFVRKDGTARDEMIVRVGRMFHNERMDTAQIAKETYLQEALVCRLLRYYRARRDYKSQSK